jgi:hypothetical protein
LESRDEVGDAETRANSCQAIVDTEIDEAEHEGHEESLHEQGDQNLKRRREEKDRRDMRDDTKGRERHSRTTRS